MDVDGGRWRAMRVRPADRERWPGLGPCAWIVVSPRRDSLGTLTGVVDVLRLSDAEMRVLTDGRVDVVEWLIDLLLGGESEPVIRGLVIVDLGDDDD